MSTLEQLYDPDHVVEIFLGTKSITCIKGSFKEQTHMVPNSDSRLRDVAVEMFECITEVSTQPLKVQTDSDHLKRYRVIGNSSSIVALILDES